MHKLLMFFTKRLKKETQVLKQKNPSFVEVNLYNSPEAKVYTSYLGAIISDNDTSGEIVLLKIKDTFTYTGVKIPLNTPLHFSEWEQPPIPLNGIELYIAKNLFRDYKASLQN